MAYGKRRRLSRGRFRRRRGRRSFARTRRFKNSVKRIVNRMSEIKWVQESHINNISQATVGSGFLQNLTPTIPIGAGSNQRIGRRVQYKYWKVRIAIELSETSNIITLPIRVVIFVPLTAFDVNVITNIQTWLFDQPLGNLQWLSTVDNKVARVLYDKMWFQGTMDTYNQAGFRGARIIKFGRRIFNHVTFNEGTDEPGELKDLLYMFVMWRPTGATAFSGSVHSATRMSFKDF